MDIGEIIGTYWALFGLLLAASIGYNRVVGWLEREGYIEGYVCLTVIGGVALTLAAVALIDWRAAALCTIAFVCSGAPMVVGSIARHCKARKREQDGLSND